MEIIVDPMNGEKFLHVPETIQEVELNEFAQSLSRCPKSGLHNPIKNVERQEKNKKNLKKNLILRFRYTIYGEVCHRVAALLHDPQVLNFFVELIQRVMPKSFIQARGEVLVVRKFLENFSGDQVKFIFMMLFFLKE
jgi:1-pyrroline-5-carboxylate dehydrogenase